MGAKFNSMQFPLTIIIKIDHRKNSQIGWFTAIAVSKLKRGGQKQIKLFFNTYLQIKTLTFACKFWYNIIYILQCDMLKNYCIIDDLIFILVLKDFWILVFALKIHIMIMSHEFAY